jgi:hypothetical protein
MDKQASQKMAALVYVQELVKATVTALVLLHS